MKRRGRSVCSTLSQCPLSNVLHRSVDHRWVVLGVLTNGVWALVEHQSAMEVEYYVADWPQVCCSSSDQHQSGCQSSIGQQSEIGRGRGCSPSTDRPRMDNARAGGGMLKDVRKTEMTKAVCFEESGPKRHYASIGMKLGTYDRSTCLEAILANVKNFAAFLQTGDQVIPPPRKSLGTGGSTTVGSQSCMTSPWLSWDPPALEALRDVRLSGVVSDGASNLVQSR